MSRTDLISDAFTIIRNAIRAQMPEVCIPHSGSLFAICGILKSEGYIENFQTIDLESFKQLKIYLKYSKKKNAITQIKKVSSPGRRVYKKKKDIPSALGGYGVTIISTSSGILTDIQAREKGLGGEIIGMIW